MSKLTSSERSKLPKKDFAVPGEHYPIEDKSHARNALARVSEYGSKREKNEVREAVHDKYPGIAEHVSRVTRK